jgi:HD-GYP domain-containing protein (c-di-GMP phosphodiesterase class II)
MTISDIYDALTASDRPYKKAVPTTKAIDILGYEAKEGKVDKALLDLFIEAKVYERTARS